MTISMKFSKCNFLRNSMSTFECLKDLRLGGRGEPPPGKISEINPYFLQSEAFFVCLFVGLV